MRKEYLLTQLFQQQKNRPISNRVEMKIFYRRINELKQKLNHKILDKRPLNLMLNEKFNSHRFIRRGKIKEN